LVETANRVVACIEQEKPDAVVIDGDGYGASVVDQLRHLGYNSQSAGLHEFHGGGRAADVNKYFNRRAEVWGLMAEWLKTAQIPDDPELEVDLCGPQYGYSNKSQIQLERKEDMKSRGLASPDLGDTLAMSFHVTLNAKVRQQKEWFEELSRYRYKNDRSEHSWMA